MRWLGIRRELGNDETGASFQVAGGGLGWRVAGMGIHSRGNRMVGWGHEVGRRLLSPPLKTESG